jgi:hypothetical protein
MRVNTAYDWARITAVNGTTVSLDRRLGSDHPTTALPNGQTMTAEVMNLTRNVRIEGTPSGYTHTFFHSTSPQDLSYTQLRYVGPRGLSPSDRANGDGYSRAGYPMAAGAIVLGRYGVHYHMMGDATAGEVSRGVVVRDCGSHAIVTHSTNNVTWQDCITDFTVDAAYWWDNPQQSPTPSNPFANNVTYDHCIASRATAGHENGAFDASVGAGNQMVNGCAAVGGLGNGMIWQSAASAWAMPSFVTHNNSGDGVFSWTQHLAQEVNGLVSYHNGGYGIAHGAYNNAFVYKGGCCYANLLGPVDVQAVSSAPDAQIMFDDMVLDAAGMSAYSMVFESPVLPPPAPVVVSGCTLRGYTVAPVSVAQGALVQVT